MDISSWNAIHSAIHYLAGPDFSKRKYCHYTTPEAVLGIFNDYTKKGMGKRGCVDQCRLRATNIRFMNDAQEYEEGLRWLSESNKNNDFSALTQEIYSISLCGEEDLLSQWKWYGKDSGVCIVFDLSQVYYQYWELGPGMSGKTLDVQTRPLPVCYRDKDKKDFFADIQEYNKKMNLDEQQISSLFIPYCKNSGFQEEKESRLIFFTVEEPEKYGIDHFSINYYTSGNIIKPTLDVTLIGKANTNLVRKFVVGPGQNQQLVFNALIHLFDDSPFQMELEKSHTCSNGIVISTSSLPFRG